MPDASGHGMIPFTKEGLTMMDKETLLKTARFQTPDYIPMTFHVNQACWEHYDQAALQDLIMEHKWLFPDYIPHKLPYVPDYPWPILLPILGAASGRPP